MSRGGVRPGAGRPKGSQDKIKREVTLLKEELAGRLAASGQMPREFLLSVMRDETREISLRIAAAKAAAPYCHATLASVDMKVHESVEELSEDELMRIVAGAASSKVSH